MNAATAGRALAPRPQAERGAAPRRVAELCAARSAEGRLGFDAYLTAWGAGRMVKVKMPGDRDRQNPGGERGEVKGYSRAARKRLLEKIHTITRAAALPQFVTLTFPDFFPDPKTAKRTLDTLFKRLKRAFPDVSAIWRMEEIDRKSGQNVGQIAPHFHLLVWGAVPAAWLDRAWWEVNGKSDYAHLKHGADAQALESWAGAVFYCAKYLAKVDSGEARASGRCWGVHNRAALPLQREPEQHRVTVAAAFRLQRFFRRLNRSRAIMAALAAREKATAAPRNRDRADAARAARTNWRRSRARSCSRTLFTLCPERWASLALSL
jgi:hypothetical protein